jgi:hypothetical protein
MSSSALVLVYTIGAAALAMWVEVRFGRLAPGSLKARFLHTALALATVQLAVPVMRLLVGDGESVGHSMFALLYVFLPALLYAFLASIWLLKLVAGGGRTA